MERTKPTVGYKPFNKALATKVVDMDISHLWCTQHQLLGSKEMFANSTERGLTSWKLQIWHHTQCQKRIQILSLFWFIFFLSLKCRCYLFKGGEWQAISLVNFPTLCKPSCCLILPGNLLHNHHSQKRSQGHVNLVISLRWNFNQHTMKVSLVRSHWPDFLQRFQQSTILKGQKNMPETATIL